MSWGFPFLDAMAEIKVRPFDNISLPCCFSFVDSTEGLSFTWEREDIKEEHEVEDKDFYKFFVALQDFYQFYPKLIYSFSDNKEQPEERNSLYEGRVWVDEEEIPEGCVTLMLEQVQFSDEAFYICKATNARGRGQRKMKLTVKGKDICTPSKPFAEERRDTLRTHSHSCSHSKAPLLYVVSLSQSGQKLDPGLPHS